MGPKDAELSETHRQSQLPRTEAGSVTGSGCGGRRCLTKNVASCRSEDGLLIVFQRRLEAPIRCGDFLLLSRPALPLLENGILQVLTRRCPFLQSHDQRGHELDAVAVVASHSDEVRHGQSRQVDLALELGS